MPYKDKKKKTEYNKLYMRKRRNTIVDDSGVVLKSIKRFCLNGHDKLIVGTSQGRCRECVRLKTIEYRKTDRHKKVQEKYKNSEKGKYIIRNCRLLYNYGLSLDEYNAMLEKQGGVCWICKTPPKNKNLHVDHRHVPKYKKLSLEDKKKEVRGLLCFSCNRGIGGIERPLKCRDILNNMIEYFKVFKMKGE